MEVETAKKLTIFTSEKRRFKNRPLYEALAEKLSAAGINNVTITKGIAGFGGSRNITTTKIEVLSYNLPIIIEATDSAEKIDRVAAAIAEMMKGGVFEVMSSEIVRHSTGKQEN
jgi:PII-like signaling protein